MALTPAQQQVVDRIIAIGRRRRAPRRQKKAALETAKIEKNYSNTRGGDADSENWRQERAAGYADEWRKTGGPLNLDASIKRFYDEAAALDHGQRAGDLAADVQRPAEQYRGRYRTASAEASRLLGESHGGTHRKVTAAPDGPSPGIDRRALLQQFVQTEDSDPDALLNLALGLREQQGGTRTPTAERHGQDAPDRPGPVGAKAALSWAESKLGKKEATGANDGKLPGRLNRKFGMSGQPWCAMFTSVAVTKGGAPKEARTASVAEVRRMAQEGRYYHGFVKNAKAKAGDLILFGNSHIGMVRSVANGKINYVGGNQSDAVTHGTASVGDDVDIVRPKYKGF